MKRIAFATCSKRPEIIEGDALAAGLLGGAGLTVEAAPWDEPAVDWSGFDGVVIRSTWNYHLKYPRFLRWLERLESLKVRVFNPIDLLRWNTDKIYLRQLEQQGIPIIPTRWIAAPGAIDDEAERCGWDEIIVKPSVSADSFETHRLKRSQLGSRRKRLETLLKHVEKHGILMLQPYLREIEEGEWSLIYFQNRFSHSVLKRAASGDFRVQEAYGGTVVEAEAPAPARELADRVLKSLGRDDLLFARVDVVRSGEGYLLGELEITEPGLFLEYCSGAPSRFAAALTNIFSAR